MTNAHNFNEILTLNGVPNLAYDNATNRITTTGYEYDAAGNQIKAPDASGNGLLLEYDAANRIQIIKKESDSSWVQAFQYGSTNARVMDMDYNFGYLKIFASVGGTTLAEYTEHTHTVPTWTKSYTYFGDTQLATVTPNGTGGEFTEFNHPDRLGTRLMTNQAGGTAYEQVTLPFGTALNAESTLTGNNRRFTSYDRSNSTGFDYAINRTYDSKQGRFTTVDPIGMSAVSLALPQTLNMYTYCGNDPINRVDPSGLFFGKLFKWIGKIFKAIMTVLKWVVVAVIVVAVAIAVFKSGGAAIGFLNSILGLVGKLLGVSMVEAPMILEFGGVLIEMTVQQISISLTTQMIAGAFAVGAIASSFAQTKDKKKKKKKRPGKYKTVDQAAIAILQDWNPVSILQNREWAGSICERINGEIFTTPPKKGTHASSNVGDCPIGTTRVGTYHTHGKHDPNYDSENFSPTDRRNANNRSLRAGNVVPNYVATPSGAIKKFTPAVISNSTRGSVKVFQTKTAIVFVP